MYAVNTTTVFTQLSPDVLWTGTQPVVGWKDESAIPRGVSTRPVTGELLPASGSAPAQHGNAEQLEDAVGVPRSQVPERAHIRFWHRILQRQ